MTTVRVRSRRSVSASRAGLPLAGLALSALLVTGCGAGAGGAQDDELTIVASTDVWGRVAEAVGGSTVTVKSIIDGNEADPHSYESTPRDAALVNDADLVVYNGAGYDSFVPQILSGVDRPKPVVAAAKVAGVTSGHEGHGHGSHEHAQGGHGEHEHSGNEHVWYQPRTVGEVAGRVADELAQLQPANAAEFRRSAAALTRETQNLEQQLTRVRAEHGGTEVLATAPVSTLMLDRAGLVDVTPDAYVQAVEAGNDPSAATIATMHDAIDSGRAAALIHNPQTTSPLTERLRQRAGRHGIPTVVMSETPPKGQTYPQWMGAQITALRDALRKP